MGPDANQWILSDIANRCSVDVQDSIPCSFELRFWPQSLGPKTATLVVRDYHGNRVTAQLKGKGVQALCEMKVVSCKRASVRRGVQMGRCSQSAGRLHSHRRGGHG